MVYCEGCGASVREKPSRRIAIDTWNARVDQDLLESLKEIIVSYRTEANPEIQSIVEIARSAIAKAEGRSQ